MAVTEKILRIKLEVDATQGGKLQAVVDSQVKSLEKLATGAQRLTQLEGEVNTARLVQTASLVKLTSNLERYNDLIKLGGTAASLAYQHSNAELAAYNNTVDIAIKKQNQLASTKFASGLSTSAGSVQEAPGAAKARQEALLKDREARETASLAKRLAAVKEYEDAVASLAEHNSRKQKDLLSQEEFAAKASYNSRAIFYANMAKEIEAKAEQTAKREAQLLRSTSAVAEAAGTSQARQAALAEARVAREAAAAQRIASFNQAINESSNQILAQQNAQRLRLDEARAQQSARNSLSFTERLNSQPRVSSQGSQRDITGTLTRHLQQQTVATQAATVATTAYTAATISAEHAQQSFVARVIEGISIYRVFTFVLNNLTNALKAIPKIGIELESTRASLLATSANAATAAGTFSFLDQEAQRTGIAITGLRETFRNFQASTRLAGESAGVTVEIFQNFNTAITALHLNADKSQSIFLALAQIFNKSKVQSEELVKQLGNLLPGAFAAFAKANNTSASQLAADMKKGIIFAHDTILNFSRFYAEQFNPSFVLASQGLNANAGRLATSFTHLGEAIYAISQENLVGIVKGLTSLTDGLTKVVNGTSEWSKVLNFLTIAVEAAAVAVVGKLVTSFFAIVPSSTAAITGIAGVSRASLALKGTLAFITSPVAIVAGLVAIGLQLRELATETDRAKERVDDFLQTIFQKAKQEGKLSIAASIDLDPNVIANKKAIKDAQEVFNKQFRDIKIRENDAFYIYTDARRAKDQANLEEAKSKLYIVKGALEETKEKARIKIEIEGGQALADVTDIVNKIQVQFLRITGKTEQASKLDLLGNSAEDLAKLQKQYAEGNQEAGEALEKFKVIYDRTGLESVTKQHSSVAKAQRDIYADLGRDAKNSSKEIQDSLKELEFDYKNNLISLASYFEKKKQLQLSDLENQLAAADQGKGIATQAGDISKIQQFEDNIQDLIRQTQEVQATADRDKFEALKEYNEKLKEIQVGALEASGREEEANAIQVKSKFDELRKFALINHNELALKQLAISEQYELSKGVLNKLSREEGELSSTLQAKEARIHLNRQSGIITQRQAQVELNKLRQEYADNEDVIIEKLKQELALNEGNTEIANRILDATNKRNEVAFAGVGFNKQFTRGPSFVTQFEDTGGQIADDREQSLRKLREANLSNLQEVKEKELAIETDYILASAKNYSGFYGGIATTGAETFLGLTTAAQKMYGEQSKQAKAAFIAYKASKVAEATMGTAKAVVEALGAGPYIGPVLAGIAASLGAVQIASIVSQPLPQAHAGLTNAPQNQTFNISKGERVVAPQQNRDLTQALANGSLSGKQSSQPQNIRIINAVDPGLFNEYLGSEQGEKVIMNIVKRNNG